MAKDGSSMYGGWLKAEDRTIYKPLYSTDESKISHLMISLTIIPATSMKGCQKNETTREAGTNDFESSKSQPFPHFKKSIQSDTQIVAPEVSQRICVSNSNVNGPLLSREDKGKGVITNTGPGLSEMDWGPRRNVQKRVFDSEPQFLHSANEDDVVRFEHKNRLARNYSGKLLGFGLHSI